MGLSQRTPRPWLEANQHSKPWCANVLAKGLAVGRATGVEDSKSVGSSMKVEPKNIGKPNENSSRLAHLMLERQEELARCVDHNLNGPNTSRSSAKTRIEGSIRHCCPPSKPAFAAPFDVSGLDDLRVINTIDRVAARGEDYAV